MRINASVRGGKDLREDKSMGNYTGRGYALVGEVQVGGSHVPSMHGPL